MQNHSQSMSSIKLFKRLSEKHNQLVHRPNSHCVNTHAILLQINVQFVTKLKEILDISAGKCTLNVLICKAKCSTQAS